jgi:putative ABC transport system substrate-binding protein
MRISIIIFLWIALYCQSLSGQEKTIGVLKSQDISPHNAALSGFKEVLKTGVVSIRYKEYLLRDANVTERIKTQKPDLILALGTPAAKEILRKVTNIPVIFSLVLDPEGGGLKGENVTGASLDIPVETQFKDLKAIVPGRKTIGVIYNPKENQRIINKAKKSAQDMGITLKTYSVESAKDIPKIEEMNIDALWLIPDTVVSQSAIIGHILLAGVKHGIPIMGFSPSYVKAGALFALSCDYTDIGRQSGEIAMKILGGAKPSDIPVSVPRKSQVYINMIVADRLGIKASKDISQERLRIIK